MRVGEGGTGGGGVKTAYGGRSLQLQLCICSLGRLLGSLLPGYLIAQYTDKKENQIFLIYKEIHSEAVAKSNTV